MGCHSLLQGIFPDLGIELGFPTLQADSSLSEPSVKTQMIFKGRLFRPQILYLYNKAK